MKRREFLAAVGWNAGAAAGLISLPVGPSPRRGYVTQLHPGSVLSGPSLLVPMDDSQSDHLKAYGVTYRALQRGSRAEWLLNYRGGSFLLPLDSALERDAALAGVRAEVIGDGVVGE